MPFFTTAYFDNLANTFFFRSQSFLINAMLSVISVLTLPLSTQRETMQNSLSYLKIILAEGLHVG